MAVRQCATGEKGCAAAASLVGRRRGGLPPTTVAASDGGSGSLLASVLRRANKRQARPTETHALVSGLRTLDLRFSARLPDRGLLSLPRSSVAQQYL